MLHSANASTVSQGGRTVVVLSYFFIIVTVLIDVYTYHLSGLAKVYGSVVSVKTNSSTTRESIDIAYTYSDGTGVKENMYTIVAKPRRLWSKSKYQPGARVRLVVNGDGSVVSTVRSLIGWKLGSIGVSVVSMCWPMLVKHVL